MRRGSRARSHHPRGAGHGTAPARDERLASRRRRLGAAALLLACFLAACRMTPTSDPRALRVAACQIHVDGDREAAFARIDAALAEAVAQGADLACFPETCLMGWVNPNAHELADPIPTRRACPGPPAPANRCWPRPVP